MKRLWNLFFVASISTVLIGCGKTQQAEVEVEEYAEETDPAVLAAEAEAAAAAEAEAAASAQFAEAFANDVQQALRQKNYEAAVETLGTFSQNWERMTPQQRLEYQQQLRNASQALLQASDNDPRAAQAYGTMIRGFEQNSMKLRGAKGDRAGRYSKLR
jgi:outer membrane receptor protein involved in Fe transport